MENIISNELLGDILEVDITHTSTCKGNNNELFFVVKSGGHYIKYNDLMDKCKVWCIKQGYPLTSVTNIESESKQDKDGVYRTIYGNTYGKCWINLKIILSDNSHYTTFDELFIEKTEQEAVIKATIHIYKIKRN